MSSNSISFCWRSCGGAVLVEVGQRLLGRAVEGHVAAARQEDHLVAHHHVLGGVGDEHDGAPLVGQLAQQLHHLELGARVEARGRLVQEEEARLGQQLDADARRA